MEGILSLSLITIIFSTMLICILFMYAIVYRRERGVRYFVWVLGCRVVYAGGVILELSSDKLADKIIFRNVEQTTLAFMVPLMVLFVLDLVGMDRWLRWKWHLIGLFACWSVLIWTDPYWHVINKTQELIGGHLVTTKTPYSLAFNLLCYAIIAGCIFALVRYILSSRPAIRKSGMWLLLLGSIPLVVEILKLVKPTLAPWLLPVSVYSGMCGIVMFWIIMRNKLFSSLPLARNIVVETMHEGMLIVDTDGRMIDSNRFANELVLGDDTRPILGRRVEEWLAAWPEWLSACLRMEERRIEISSSAGPEKRSYIVNVYPFFSGRRRRLGTVSIIIDITEKQQALEQIARLNQMKDQLLTAVSHDIRDPLSVQVSLVEVLETTPKTLHQPESDIIQALSEQVRSTYAMVENLLEWFRGQKEGILLYPESLNVAEVAGEACRLLAGNAKAKQVELRIHMDDNIRVHADREALLLIVRNLLSNAIKFSSPGGVVVVSATSSGGRVDISVRDEGVGMSEEQIRQVFDENRFASTAGTAGEKGTGLGLLVSQQFLRMGGGRLDVRSEPGAGSTFTIVLEDGDI